MKRIIAILLASLSVFNMPAQVWDWAIRGGGSMADKGNDISLDAQGNIYIGGYYNYSGTFGSLPVPSDFGKEGLLAKVSPNGTWTWLRAALGGWDERVLGIHVDTINNFVYATGCCWYYTDFGSCFAGSAFPGGADEIFIAKFDLNGNCIWLKGAGGDSDDHGYDMVTDPAGNIYLTGFISDEYFFNTPCMFGSIPVMVTPGDSTAFLAKMTPAGNFVWVKTFQATDGERDNRLAIDANNNIYVAGGFWGTKNLGMGNVTSYGGIDIFVTKFDQNGNQQWVRTTGSAWSDRANAVHVDHFGNIYVTGEFRDRVGFDADSINNNGGPGGRDIFVSRITPSGNWVWAKKAGSKAGADRGNRIVSNRDANLFVTGQFKDSAYFGNNILLVSNNDSVQVFVAAIDTNGKWKWAVQGGGPSEDRGNSLAVDDSCHIYVTGFFQQTADFGGNMITATARRDIFVARLDSGCFVYTVPPPPPPPPPADPCTITSIPNVISPNGDDLNDILWLDKDCMKEIRFTLYNRWGNLLHSSYNPDMLWDGKVRGKDALTGVYYYVCQITEHSGEIKIWKGFITLLR